MFEKCSSCVNKVEKQQHWKTLYERQVFPFIMTRCKHRTVVNNLKNVIGRRASFLLCETQWSRDLLLLVSPAQDAPVQTQALYSSYNTHSHSLCFGSVSQTYTSVFCNLLSEREKDQIKLYLFSNRPPPCHSWSYLHWIVGVKLAQTFHRRSFTIKATVNSNRQSYVKGMPKAYIKKK